MRSGMKRAAGMLRTAAAVFAIVAVVPAATAGKVRRPAVAGSWYPADGQALRRLIEGFLSGTGGVEVPGKPIAVIAPHAGYRFSGRVAAYAFAALKGKRYRRVIVLAPSHYGGFTGASIADVDAYETPLGKIPIDKEAVARLRKSNVFSCHPAAHAREHSIEMELPFLQCVLEDFRLVPVLIGRVDGKTTDEIASLLSSLWNEDTLVVVSSDFTHYGPNYDYVPFTRNVEENLHRLDMEAARIIESMNAAAFDDFLRRTGDTICGRNPIRILLRMLAKKKHCSAKLMKYDTSGRMTGNFRNSVSYEAFCFTMPYYMVEGDLSRGERAALLKLARYVLERYVSTHRRPPIPKWFVPTQKMKEKRGVFVTLEKNGMLRGCIGYIRGIKPLYEAVVDNTINACSRDPRFRPVTPRELKDVTISISVMSPLIEVKDTDEILVGRDGLVIERGFKRGVLLPQVPIEQGWDRKRFLEGVCRKAGLPADAWKKARLWRFGAQVFYEEDYR